MAGGYLQVSIIYENGKTHLSKKVDDETVHDHDMLREALQALSADAVNAFVAQNEG